MDLVSIFRVVFMIVAALAPIAINHLPELPMPPDIIAAIVIAIAVAIVGSIGAIKTRRSEQNQQAMLADHFRELREFQTTHLADSPNAQRHLQATTDNLVREVARLARTLEALRATIPPDQADTRQKLDGEE